MKRAFLILSIVMSFSSAAWAQIATAEKVPAQVKRAFQIKFPDVTRVEWKIKQDNNFEAEFTFKGAELSAKFDAAGK